MVVTPPPSAGKEIQCGECNQIGIYGIEIRRKNWEGQIQVGIDADRH